jgi:hypothetical protein
MRAAWHRRNGKAINGAWTTTAEYSNNCHVTVLRLRQPSLRMTGRLLPIQCDDSGFPAVATRAAFSFSFLLLKKLADSQDDFLFLVTH